MFSKNKTLVKHAVTTCVLCLIFRHFFKGFINDL